jgi:hypothetical protein
MPSRYKPEMVFSDNLPLSSREKKKNQGKVVAKRVPLLYYCSMSINEFEAAVMK